jgi:adenylate cyclase
MSGSTSPSDDGTGAGPGADDAWARVRSMLRAAGATDAEIDAAVADDVVDLLLADRLLVPTVRRLSAADVAAETGVGEDLIRTLWRALGLPVPDPDDAVFGDLDVEAVDTFATLLRLGVADPQTTVQLARVIGTAMARIAEAELTATVSTFSAPGVDGSRADGPGTDGPDAEGVGSRGPGAGGPGAGGPGAGGPGAGGSIEAAERFASLADESLPAVARLLEYVWRRHLQAATRRAMLQRTRGARPAPDVAVGFADMVGFTSLSQQLDERRLAELVGRFEAVAHDTVSGLGGRVVKMIGDEVMFVTETPAVAAAIGLRLAELYADDDLLSDVRVGLAWGPVLVQDGDYYGPVVNLASRIVRIADPGTVLVADELHRMLTDETGGADAAAFAFDPLRPRVLKDVGRVQLWNLHRPGVEPSTVERRSGRRWQRWNEVLRDLDAVRARGERVVEEARRTGRFDLGAVAEEQAGHGH